MSEQPETYSAQEAEAEAEGVRPLSEVDTELMREFWASKIPGATINLLDLAREAIGELADALDAARAELERKEAEAATYRRELQAIRAGNWGGLRDTLNEIIDLTLSNTTAGAALLERVRQLEGEVAAMKLVVITGVYYVREMEYTANSEDAEDSKSSVELLDDYGALRDAVAAYDQQHQGTGAAGEVSEGQRQYEEWHASILANPESRAEYERYGAELDQMMCDARDTEVKEEQQPPPAAPGEEE